MQKPVWRIEKENKNGMETVYIPDILPDVVLLIHSADVYAYQTTRTKAAKYRRVECKTCIGRARYADNYDKAGCPSCNGRGTQWEKLPCK